jgi:hypothetical protein
MTPIQAAVLYCLLFFRIDEKTEFMVYSRRYSQRNLRTYSLSSTDSSPYSRVGSQGLMAISGHMSNEQ